MTRTTHTPENRFWRSARRGFTLVEILVVIGIMIILVALSAAALQKTREGASYNRTSEQVYKLQKSLGAEVDRINTKARATDVPSAVLAYCDNDPQRANSVYTALEQRRNFPQTFAEANSPAYIVQVNATGAYGLRLGSYNNSTETPVYIHKSLAHFAEVSGLTPTGNANEESGVLLYIILSKASASGGGAMASAADDLSSAQRVTISFTFTSTSGTTKVEKQAFADGFKRAVGFNRWDNRNELQVSPYVDPKASFKDPLDPQNRVGGWLNSGLRQGELQTLLSFGGVNRTISVYSYGKNGVADTASPPAPADDDVLGFRVLQAGNKGF